MHRISICSLAFCVFFGAVSQAAGPALRPYDVQNYAIELEIEPAPTLSEFNAQVEIRFKATETLSALELDVDELSIDKVIGVGALPGRLEFKADGGKLQIPFPRPLAKNRTGTLRIHYRGKVRSEQRGFFKVQDPDDAARGTLLFTHFEPSAARAFFPCNDEPYDKATTEMRVRTPASFEVLSNGRRTLDRKYKKQGTLWHEVRWRLDRPHSSYLVSLAIGAFSKVEKAFHGKENSVWVGHSQVEKAKYALDATVEAMRFFEDYLGTAYPWPKYATVGLPTFLWGGMENTSSTHMNQERTLLNDPHSEFEKKRIVALVAHELAHQWFGDDVTLRWWDDLWLNEAFASYLGSLATAAKFKEEEAIESVTYLWSEYFRQEDGPRSHPIVDKSFTSAEDSFDAISYTKGEQVLATLNRFIGDKAFRAGLKGYLKDHAYANATYSDFFHAMERASGQDLTAFRDAWLLQKGYPVVSYRGSWDAKALKYRITVSQHSNHAGDSSLFPFRLPVAVHRRNTPSFDQSAELVMTQPEQTLEFSVPAEPDWVTLNVGGESLVKLKADPNQETALIQQAAQDPDAVSRVWALDALATPVREGGEITEAASKALLHALEQDTSPYVRLAVLSGFQKSKSRWLPEDLADAVFRLAKGASEEAYGRSPMSLSDTHGWTQWRAQLIATLGKVHKSETLPLLQGLLAKKELKLDDLGCAAHAVAVQGEKDSAKILKEALARHGARGYRYRFLVQSAYGSFENSAAASEIRQIAQTASVDLIGRLSNAIRDNQTLKNSDDWAGVLKELLGGGSKFNDDIKSRLLTTIEEVKTSAVRRLLEEIAKENPSERMKGSARKILEKNFPQSQS